MNTECNLMDRSRKIIAVLFLATLVAALALTGCSQATSAPSNSATDKAAESSASAMAEAQANAENITVTVTAKGEDDAEVLTIAEVVLPKDATAFDALQATSLDIVATETEHGMFVESIDGIENEGQNGWIYTVNGESTAVSSDACVLEDGDDLVWTYHEE